MTPKFVFASVEYQSKSPPACARRYPAEIVYIFKDRYGDEWVEVRWLYTKDEIEETVPRSR